MSQGHGLQIVKVLTNHTYELDERLLEQVLLKKEIKDLPVVVVSVAGAYRGGKSFLLNFFIRYLSASESSRDDGSWLGAESAPLKGFNWRGGAQRNTTGILLWSEPFINTLANGKKVAVLLMDTQGTFDSRSTIRDNSTIFALSTLVSSIQIYNLSMNIQEDDLQHLQLFTMYGKMVQEKNPGKPFQKLEFLVRDWPYPYDYPFGKDGGKRLLTERLEVSPDQPEELRELRTHIRSCFEEVLCYLMPHPGFKVLNPAFKGNIGDIDPDFRNHLKILVSSLFREDKMSPKTINEQTVKAGELFNYFKAYMTLFNSDKVPTPRSILQATAEAGLLSSMNEARDVYEKGMSAECGPTKPAVPANDVEALHKKYLAAAKTAFTTKKTMATQEDIDKTFVKVTKELETRLPQYEQSNLSKLQTVMKEATNVYEQKFHDVTKKQPLCLHPLDLDKLHEEAIQAAWKVYDGKVKKITQNPDQTRIELTQISTAHFVELKLNNDYSNKDAVKDQHIDYWRFMDTKSLNPPMAEVEFKRNHEDALKQAQIKFLARRNRPSSYPNDIYKEELLKAINDTFWRLQAINQRKIEQENTRQTLEEKRKEQDRIKDEQAQMKAELERIKGEQEITRLQQEKEKVEQEKRRAELENERLKLQNSGRGGGRRGCTLL